MGTESLPSNLTSKQWEQVACLFKAGLELPPERRAAFLLEACGSDHAVRVEAERLLAAVAEPGVLDGSVISRLRTTPVGKSAGGSSSHSTSSTQEGRFPAGTLLGRYRILGLAGTGGMGEVYRAIDTKLRALPRLHLCSWNL